MKKLLLAGLAGATALTVAAPAEAHPNWHWMGPGCGFLTISDGTETDQTKWDGEIHVMAVATDAAGNPDPTASITVECELRINGATPGTIVFTCSTPGTGVVSCAGQFSFNAHPDDIVTMCDIVTVNGERHKDCGNSTTIPIVPEVVQEILDEQVWPTVDPTIEEAVRITDELICAVTKALDETVVDQGNDSAFETRNDGDLYVNGEWIWDCPPYGSSGPRRP